MTDRSDRAVSHRGTVVVGTGNPDRGDDGLGHAVVAALAGRLPADVVLALLDGEPTRLIDTWFPATLAVVVDAAAPPSDGGVPAGTIHVIELDVADQVRLGPGGAPAGAAGSPGSPVLPDVAMSSHGSGVATAIALGAVLGRLPDRLVVVAVTAATFDLGAPMSEPVRTAVPQAADAVVAACRERA